MKYYFLPLQTVKDNVGETAISICGDYEYSEFQHLSGKMGWLIPIDSIQPLLTLLQATIVSKLPTNTISITEIVIKKAGKIVSYISKTIIKPGILDDFDGMNKDAFKQIITEILVPHTSYTCIDMRTPHGLLEPLRTLNTLYIHIDAVPTGQKDTRIPSSIMDIPVSSRYNAYSCSWRGIPIVDESTRYIVGELLDNNLYIYHNIAEHGSRDEQLLFRKILEKTLHILSMSASERVAYVEKIQVYRYAADREKYVDHCSKRLRQEISMVRGSVEQARKEVALLQNQLTAKIREAVALEKKEQSLHDPSAIEETFGREFDKLRSMKEVINIEVSTNNIHVYTKKLYCRNPNTSKLHEIGAFKISIPTTSTGSVKWENLTRRKSGYKTDQMAPHIWADGSACLGNTATTFSQLIGQYEFSTVAMLAIKFVQSVNMNDSAGKTIINWPVVEREEE